jgi:XTP/dITP diphosphohydrolase
MDRAPLLIATANAHKLREYAALLADVPARLLSLADTGIEALPEETGATFEENALLKARYCARASGLPSLADDSGLEVDALGGEPGVHSNRWAGPGRSDADRVRLLLERVRDVPEDDRGARFVCIVAVVLPDGAERTFRGVLEGRLETRPRGAGGFGYDPILYLPELGRTVAELPADEKNRISHRARAVHATIPWLRDHLPQR